MLTDQNIEMINIRPLKQKASALGGMLKNILDSEPDIMKREEFLAKCTVWLRILDEQLKVKLDG
ncbi:MAG: hypothetical protein QXZ17_10150 [Nitrososphaerota archaeon]